MDLRGAIADALADDEQTVAEWQRDGLNRPVKLLSFELRDEYGEITARFSGAIHLCPLYESVMVETQCDEPGEDGQPRTVTEQHQVRQPKSSAEFMTRRQLVEAIRASLGADAASAPAVVEKPVRVKRRRPART